VNWKGYVFCAISLVVAAGAWLRPIAPAAAATSSAKYEYQCLDYSLAGEPGFISTLNAQGAQGWSFVDQKAYGCILLVREKQ
jgi:hypothetical protein